MSGENPGVIGVDLGGTRLRVAVFDAVGELRHKSVVPTPDDDPGALPRVMKEAVEACGKPVEGAVVGVPGPISYAEGCPFRLPNLPKWEERLSARWLADEVRVPVLLANDADLAALSEHRYGAGKGAADMLYVTSSTGVGAGVIIGGRLLHGERSLAEGGHVVIDWKRGETAEYLGSGTALERLAGMDGAEVTKRARAGDEQALAAFRDVAGAFAVGVANLAHCFMPERVVIGGGVSRAGDLLLDPVREHLRRCGAGCPVRTTEVVPAQGGDDVGLLGAFALWMDEKEEGSRLTPTQPNA